MSGAVRTPRTIEELLADGMLPIKAEYRRQDTGPPPPLSSNPPAGKSKKKQKQDRNSSNICHMFVTGTCSYGERCKRSHDAAAYVAARPADLPGACPFTQADACPYSISCRWASTHTTDDDLHRLLRAHLEATSTTPAPSSPTPAAAATEPPPPAQEGPAAVTPPAGSPVETLTLPTYPVAPSLNTVSKDVQISLRKQQYDFAATDAILLAAGVALQRQPKANQRGRGNKAGKRPPYEHQPDSAKKPKVGDASPDPTAAAPLEVEIGAVPAGTEGVGGPPEDVPQAIAARAAEPTHPGGPPAAGLGDTKMAAAAAAGDSPVKVYDVRGGGAAPGGLRDSRMRPGERKRIDFRGKLYLAPLTTVGNLPFRKVCKDLGADVTCGEMALCTNLLQGQPSEWALLKKHPSEDCFGVQICGGFANAVGRCAQLITDQCEVDFVDINMGCPIDLVCQKSAGSALLKRPARVQQMVELASQICTTPLTFKLRKGYNDNEDVAHTMLPAAATWGAAAVTLHGRTRAQRYSRLADWDYVAQCREASPDLQLIGNGDIYSYTDFEARMKETGVATCMLARGAIIKPWIFTEIKEQRHWDISASERLDLLKEFCAVGLTHWGSDSRGVETVRRFLLEWLSFLCRYVPVGLMEVLPMPGIMNLRPQKYYGRSDLETLLSSTSAEDWVRISEMLLGPVPPSFTFVPKHKANAYPSNMTGPISAE